MTSRIADGTPQPDALLTDLYQLTMLQGYFEQRMFDTAVFEFFARKLPDNRRFLIAAGLEQLLQYLEHLRFTPEELDWLRTTRRFTGNFVDYLAELRFEGDVHAMPEGTVCFQDEPLVRITAPLPVAQLIESRLINILHFQTLIASKAARCVLVWPDALLVDFGMRRAHGAEAALYAARAGFIAGMSGTATVLAGRLFEIPLYGTMAHSFILAHADETTAFEHFATSQPRNIVLLIDTYDTERAAHKVVELAARLKARGIAVRGVRIDSGDLAAHAHAVRAILDAGGCRDLTIFASGSLDEYTLAKLKANGAPIDGFGIGTALDTSADQPYLDCAYKLEEYAGIARRKRSEHKETWPGAKQVYRELDPKGRYSFDILTVAEDREPGMPLLHPVMMGGKRLSPPEPLSAIRARAKESLASLPNELCAIDGPFSPYPVRISDELRSLTHSVDVIRCRT